MPKRNVFVSFFQSNRTEVDEFVDRWAGREGVFTPKVLGISTNDEFINSDNPEYVMSNIREKYLGDSTVTIVLMGSLHPQPEIRRLGAKDLVATRDPHAERAHWHRPTEPGKERLPPPTI